VSLYFKGTRGRRNCRPGSQPDSIRGEKTRLRAGVPRLPQVDPGRGLRELPGKVMDRRMHFLQPARIEVPASLRVMGIGLAVHQGIAGRRLLLPPPPILPNRPKGFCAWSPGPDSNKIHNTPIDRCTRFYDSSLIKKFRSSYSLSGLQRL